MQQSNTERDDSREAGLGVLMLDLEGLALSAQERDLLANPHVGGVILFARNFANPQQLLQLTAAIRECAPDILIAVDQEGGRVQRLRNGYTRLPPMMRLADCWKVDKEKALLEAVECGWLMASEVLASGIDISFAPVLDIESGISQVIGDRAFGHNAEQVITLASAFMSGMRDAGMATTGKHFPGHGSVAADSHVDLPIDPRPLEEIRANDLQAFKACIDQLDAVMPAHVIYSAVDQHCAGFSPYWLQTILRAELGFDGVIFSDDLAMAGAASVGPVERRVDAALEAGCDMVLVCNEPQMARQALAYIESINTPLSPRLPRMRARRHWTREDLSSSTLWQQASETIARLVEGK
ncbi:MAG: beta-N-acetylhexosaminidase [Pseudohongiellaceae bacterium]|nr:beta-N-acetylhexosaminidase [Pseudohongiellaceae bacterium]